MKIELAATVKAMESFVRAPYNLEGDGPLALRAYQEPRTVEAGVANAYYPNVISCCDPLPLSRKCSCGTAVDGLCQTVYTARISMLQDKFIYGLLQPLVMIFISCRLFDPVKVK